MSYRTIIRICLIFLVTISALTEISAEKEFVLKFPNKVQKCIRLKTLDSNNCIAVMSVNSHTIINRTSDKGETWLETGRRDFNDRYEEDSVFTLIFADIVDTNNIFFTYGDNPIIMKTTDGGKTFKKHSIYELKRENERYSFMLLDMYNENIGVAIADSRDTLVVTRDGWDTYNFIKLKSAYHYIREPSFYLDSVNIVFCKIWMYGPGFVRYNLDENKWYEYAPVPKYERWEKKRSLNDYYFIDDQVGYGCGTKDTGIYSGKRDIIYKTTDKGQSWNTIYIHERRVNGIDIAFANEYVGAVLGFDDEMMFTYDGGKSWEYLTLPDEIRHSYGVGTKIEYLDGVLIITRRIYGIFKYEDITSIEGHSFSNVNIKKIQTKTDFHIEIEDPKMRDFEILVVSMDGRKILDQKLSSTFSGTSEYIDLVSLPQGSYMYLVSSNNQLLATGKFVNVR